MLALGSGKSGSCSRPETKTEPAKGKIYPESVGYFVNQGSNFVFHFASHSTNSDF
jgi:hypothetical protein